MARPKKEPTEVIDAVDEIETAETVDADQFESDVVEAEIETDETEEVSQDEEPAAEMTLDDAHKKGIGTAVPAAE